MDENHLKNVEKKIEEFFLSENLKPNDKLNYALRYLAKYRSMQLGNTIIQHYGTKVFDGPFKNMEFLSSVSEGCFIPKLLGNYESELHDYIKSLVIKKPDIIINVGSAEGYYAVGLKRLLPDTKVFAFDIDKNAQDKCKELSQINNVEVIIEGEFKPEILNEFKNSDVSLMCDIEGEEINLVTEDNLNLFQNTEVCMELHYNYEGKHNMDIIPNFFKLSHETDLIWQKGKDFEVPDLVAKISHLDILLSAWEFRSYPTPWLIAKPLH